ncbi:glycosyltransferase family 4 protein [Haloferax sp. KTX1]|uniref:glycosyltransferase family 4 protein n=1 Tax=Haloferax sp. KTX1 TaxID=2600597 RepID=UPI0011DCC599|nr:glycosyltransferase family 4 protein [Haloferax sp. KTX1]
MKVLLVTPDYPPPPGGIQTVVKNLERGLNLTEHDPIVLQVDPTDYESTFKDRLPSKISFQTVASFKPHLHTYFNAVYRESLKAISEHNPDIVHALHIREWPALFAAQKVGIPTVVSTHALELREKHLSSIAFSNSDAVHSVSEFTSSILQRDHDLTPDRVIPPSIDIGQYNDFTDSEYNSNDSTVFSISRMVERKNMDTIVDAWEKIDPDVRENHRLELAGTGPLYDSIESQSTDLEDVHLLGRISETEKQRRLQNADLFVLPAGGSGYDVEGFGIVYLEAQATGTPVIGSSIGGVPEAVGDAGLLLEDEQDSDELATKMNRMLTDPAVRDRCSSAANQRVDEFDLIPIADRYVDLYDLLLQEY